MTTPAGKHVGRITFEILRPVPMTTLTVSARVARPGRSVELIEASLADADGEVMRATAWRLRTQPVELEPRPADEPPAHGPADGDVAGLLPDRAWTWATTPRWSTGS